MLGWCLIAKFLSTKIGPRRVITCSRDSPEVSTGSYPFKVSEQVENNACPSPRDIRFFLKMRETSGGTSYKMVRMVFRHFAADERFARRHRNEPSPEIPLTLPFSIIFRGFSACSHLPSYLNHSQDHGQWQVCMCARASVGVWKNTENPEENRDMRVVQVCVCVCVVQCCEVRKCKKNRKHWGQTCLFFARGPIPKVLIMRWEKSQPAKHPVKDFPKYSMMVLVVEYDFEFILATFRSWQPSTTSWMIVPIKIFIISTLEIALANIPWDVLVLMSTLEIALANIPWDVLVLMSTLEIALANIPWDVLVLESTLEIALANTLRDVLVLLNVADVHQCSKSGLSLPSVFCVPSLWPPFIPFPLSPFHLELTLLDMKDLLFVLLGFPKHAVSERQISRVFWTIRNSRFLEVRWTEQHSEVHTSFFPSSHLRVSRTPDF